MHKLLEKKIPARHQSIGYVSQRRRRDNQERPPSPAPERAENQNSRAFPIQVEEPKRDLPNVDPSLFKKKLVG